MKLTPATKKILTFMASTPGRVARIVMGVSLIALAISLSGAWLALAILGGFMIFSGTMNYCPMGPLFGHSAKSGELLKNLQKYDLK